MQYLASYSPRTYAQHSLVGTYCAGDEHLPSARYYTFMRGDVYYTYQQSGSMESGRYTHIRDSFYRLSPENGDSVLLSIEQEGLDRIGEDGHVVWYAKISDTPMFIGGNQQQ
jgi:hypothetical protein